MEVGQVSLETMVTKKKNFWFGKKVLVTGHTGFKGSWLSLWLNYLGANLIGLSLDPEGPKSIYEQIRLSELMDSLRGDIRNKDVTDKIVKKYQPEVIFHLAAQPLVRKSYEDPLSTFTTNVIGTANLLESAKLSDVLKIIVVVTSDKCYQNLEINKRFKETDPLGGNDPYSSSKACAELVSLSYRESFLKDLNISLATARAGNVIGGGDWSEDRLIPDLIKAVESGNHVKIRNPKAIRPWQHVLEPLCGYLRLAQKLWDDDSYSSAWNFGPNTQDEKNVEWVVNYFLEKFQLKDLWVLDQDVNPPEAFYLKLNSKKAKSLLNWKPKWNLSTTLDNTYDWYEQSFSTENMQEFSVNQINMYQEG